ncbi:MAG: VWA domain-containing protein [Phycisphaerales bacterium]|nr:VWA domain-containing protein [Phycisphaerales bacterium]
MTFLAPAAALIAAAITLPLLLGFYMLKLRRKPVVISSTLLWDAAIRDMEANVPLRWLKANWMLLLHLLLLALLVMALGRPALDAGRGRADTVIFMIDRSASMNTIDEGETQTRFEIARARALDTLADLRSGGFRGSAGVIAFGSRATVAARIDEDLNLAQRALETITPSEQPADLPAALSLAEALLTREVSEEEPIQTVLALLFSDGSMELPRGMSLAGAELTFERVGPEDRTAGVDNLGIVALSATRDYEDPAVLRVFARIHNARMQETSTSVTLRMRGEAAERRAVTVPAASVDENGDIIPGHRGLAFEIEDTEGGVLSLDLDRSDALGADNAAAVVVQPAGAPALLLVTPDGALPGPTREAAGIVNVMLGELLPRSLNSMGIGRYDTLISQGVMPEAEALVFFGVEPERMPQLPSLSLGAGLPIEGLRLAETTRQGGTILSWERRHPVLRDVAMDTLVLGTHRTFAETGDARVLARGPGGPLIAIREAAGRRHIGVSFPLEQSNWAWQVGFAIFIANGLDHITLRAETDAGIAFTTAEPAGATASAEAVEIIARDAEGTAIARVSAEGRAGEMVSLGIFERVGVFALEGAAEPALAINLMNERESLAAPSDEITVSGVEVSSEGGPGIQPREIWRWFVIAAAIILMIEWYLYARRMRV